LPLAARNYEKLLLLAEWKKLMIGCWERLKVTLLDSKKEANSWLWQILKVTHSGGTDEPKVGYGSY
jgi:hypothetical protein